jgi:fructose-1,6-bisphosphatase II
MKPATPTQSGSSLPPLRTPQDLERVLEFEFVRATENAALNAIQWLGRGEKEQGDAAACDAIYGVFDILDIRGEVIIGEGIKDNAPGIFVGERLGTWKPGSPRFDIALDPIDGTTNLAKGMPNSISVIAAAQVPDGAPTVMGHLPSHYSHKIAYGPPVAEALGRAGQGPSLLDMPVPEVLRLAAAALGKHVRDLVVMTLDRPRHADIIRAVRATGAGLRMVGDGDITAAVAPSLPGSGIDLYLGMGGSPEAVLAAAALKCLGGDMQVRMWFHDEAHRAQVAAQVPADQMGRVWGVNDLVVGESALFCATGISDSALLPGIRITGHRAETHSILMRARSRTVRRIHAIHHLDHKVIPLRSRSR